MNRELNGLILVGGKSRRMGKDKSSLKVGGQLLLDKTSNLLRVYCKEVFVSCRQEQSNQEHLKNMPKIFDSAGEIGPLGGIISALDELKSDIFVVACDLPNLNTQIMDSIFEEYNKNTHTNAITFFNTQRGHIEPLCSIYKYEIIDDLKAKANEEIYCPNKILNTLQNVTKIDLKNDTELEGIANMNTPQDFLELTNESLK